MKRAWMLCVVVALGLAVSCSDTGGGTGGDGGNTPPPDGGPGDAGCTGASCVPDGGTPDGGTPDGGPTASPLSANPDRIVIGTTPGAAKTAQLTLQNTSGSTVTVQSLNVSGNGAAAFSVPGANVPMDVAAGASATLTVSFDGTAGVSQATLAAATPAGTTNVPLGGLAILAGTEPSLQWIFKVHNIPVDAGNPNESKKDLPAVPSIAGDEIGIQSFVKAGDGPVTLQLIGSFGPDFEPVSINGWYVSGIASLRTELFRIAQANHFALDPPIEGGGTTSFDPGPNAFGFWNEWPFWETPNQGIGHYFVYQEDALNTWDSGNGGKHHVRVYPYKNPDGTLDPHAYIVTTEEAPVSVGPDYNDVVYVVRNVVPAGTGGGALQLLNQDGVPSNDRMVFSVITTIAPCWEGLPLVPLVVKDTGTLTIRNLSGGTVTVSSVDVSDAYTATPSTPLPAALAPGVSLDLTVKFVATDGRVHNGTLTIHSDDPTAATPTVALAGFRQDVPQNTFFPQTSTEPDLDEVVNGLYGYQTVVGTKQQLIDVGEQRIAVGEEVLSAYWVKADPSRPVTARLLNAFHSGFDCGDPRAKAYGSFAFWFPKGRTGASDDSDILDGAREDIQRLLPRKYSKDPQPATDPGLPAAGSFDPKDKQFGFHIEAEFSDETLLGPLDIVPNCPPGQVCGHRMRFWPLKDARGNVVANAWLVSVDMHRSATPGRPQDFFSNYDYNDETYLFENMIPAPP